MTVGYSMSQEQVEKLERFASEGRTCRMATRWRENGGSNCFNRAIHRTTELTWSYCEDKNAFDADPTTGPAPRLTVGTFCQRHVMPAGFEGGNFRVVRVERF
jgi:hypothetical protein